MPTLGCIEIVRYKAIVEEIFQAWIPKIRISTTTRAAATPGTRTSGRRDCKRLPLPTVTWFCLCRRQGGPTTFAPTTSNTTEHYGTISTGLLGRRDNRRAYKPENPSP